MTDREIRENHFMDGVMVSRYSISVSNLSEYPVIEKCYADAAQKFIEHTKKVFFKRAEQEYTDFCSNGGRRSKFEVRGHLLKICETYRNEDIISLLIEKISLEGVKIKYYHRESCVWDLHSRQVVFLKTLKGKSKRKYDGFYVKDSGVVFYKVKNGYEKEDLKMRDLNRLSEEWV